MGAKFSVIALVVSMAQLANLAMADKFDQEEKNWKNLCMIAKATLAANKSDDLKLIAGFVLGSWDTGQKRKKRKRDKVEEFEGVVEEAESSHAESRFPCNVPGCNRVGRAFLLRRALYQHKKKMHAHFMGRSFICDIPGCNMSFSVNDSLLAHKQMRHSRNQSFVARSSPYMRIFSKQSENRTSCNKSFATVEKQRMQMLRQREGARRRDPRGEGRRRKEEGRKEKGGR
eukprot:gnl/MRDRNA2_/MRDRNA2_15510_c0_seq1.p1 gnl/MRDRNA2_/MRDRNA2_15510_c0~~gnl/MRDRNA2_/MRDRNA2_15510_c0_seq1.p1  ORF type:complete len:229 (+),score=37.23 gnl/MRDRNA2_/MRDRNA2_15510_c0_seq1:239-925(+)